MRWKRQFPQETEDEGRGKQKGLYAQRLWAPKPLQLLSESPRCCKVAARRTASVGGTTTGATVQQHPIYLQSHRTNSL